MIDEETRDRLRQEHEEKYNQICIDRGIFFHEADFKWLGITKEELPDLYEEDRHLNNIPLRLWDNFPKFTGRGAPYMKVCILKRAAARSIGK